MNLELLITNIGFTISAVTTIGLGIFVLFKSKQETVNIIFFLFSIAAATFMVSHVIGINMTDPEASRRVFMSNVCNVFIVALNTHWVLILIDKVRESRRALKLIYFGAFAYVILVAIFPASFLLPSTPRLYFPSYYVPGPLYPYMSIYFFVVMGYFLYQIISTYRNADALMKNRLRYIIVGLIFGYSVGVTPLLLLYGINFDPIISILVGLYTMPFAYSIVKYELMDIKIVAKRALLYASLVVLVGLILSALNYVNLSIIDYFPTFPRWLLPFGSSFVVVVLSIFVWNKIRESDDLKYEFINIISHKFRTPITHIKWEAENLQNSPSLSNDDRDSLKRIDASNRHLIELTDLLLSLADSDAEIVGMVRGIVADYKTKCAHHKIEFDAKIPDTPIFVSIDQKRIRLVLQILLDNALSYTAIKGRIDLHLNVSETEVSITVTDTGIGISKKDLPLIFSRFFRSSKAKTYDTEGMGVGLFMARSILEKHEGVLKVSSPGENKGSTFEIVLPIRREIGI
jgi:signal transduction histidine kinase